MDVRFSKKRGTLRRSRSSVHGPTRNCGNFPSSLLNPRRPSPADAKGTARQRKSEMLSSVIFRFGMIEAQILGTSPEMKDELAQAKNLLTKGLDEIHRISDALRPSELDALGLVPSTRSLCEEFETKAKLEVKFESKLGMRRLEDKLELTLYRIVQEALTNIEKHAGATKATVHLSLEGKEIQLTIHDNGKGLESTSVRLKSAKKMGMGLLNMRERTVHLGGVFSMNSKDGEGTTICVRIPLQTSGQREENEA